MRAFCHCCGQKYTTTEQHPWVCDGCGNHYYDNPRPAADIVLFDEREQVLISERAFEPAKGQYNLPGGFIEKNETLEAGAARELTEELGLSPKDYGTLRYATSIVAPYPFKGETYHLVVPIFCAIVRHPEKIQSLDDSASVKFVRLDTLDDIDFSLEPGVYPSAIRQAHALLFDKP